MGSVKREGRGGGVNSSYFSLLLPIYCKIPCRKEAFLVPITDWVFGGGGGGIGEVW